MMLKKLYYICLVICEIAEGLKKVLMAPLIFISLLKIQLSIKESNWLPIPTKFNVVLLIYIPEDQVLKVAGSTNTKGNVF